MTEEAILDRRSSDIGAVLSDLRVSVARIESTQTAQADTMKRLEGKLDLGVFREEYERRHKELADLVTTVANDYQRRAGQDVIWRGAISVAIVGVGSVAGALALHLIR